MFLQVSMLTIDPWTAKNGGPLSRGAYSSSTNVSVALYHDLCPYQRTDHGAYSGLSISRCPGHPKHLAHSLGKVRP